MIMTVFDDDQILKAYTKDIRDSAVKETAEKAARETAKRMIEMGRLQLEETVLYVLTLWFDELKGVEVEVRQIT